MPGRKGFIPSKSMNVWSVGSRLRVTAVFVATLSIVLTMLAGVVAVNPAQAAAATGWRGTAVKVNANLEGLVNLGAVNMPCGSITTPATTFQGTVYRYAIWTEKALTDSSSGSFLVSRANSQGEQQAPESGEQLRISSITCRTDGDFTLGVDPSQATNYQNEVELIATAEQMAQHLLLVYINTDESVDIPVVIDTAGAPTTDVVVSGLTYNASTGKATFTKGSDGKLHAQLTVSVPRTTAAGKRAVGLSVQSASVDAADAPKVIRDLSSAEGTDTSTWRTKRIYDVVAVKGGKVTIKPIDYAQVTVYTPSIVYPNDQYTNKSSFPMLARLMRLKGCDASGNSCTTGGKDDTYIGVGDSDNWEHDYQTWNNNEYLYKVDAWGKDGPNGTVMRSPSGDELYAPIGGGRTSVNGKNYVVFTPSRQDIGAYDKNGAPVGYRLNGKDSLRTGIGGQVSMELEMLPFLTRREGNVYDRYNGFMAVLQINGQEFSVPMPQPCIEPGTGAIDGYKCVRVGGMRWGDIGKDVYTKYRAWMLTGNAATTTWNGNIQPRILMEQKVTSGANAGATIRVSLVNVRSGSDTYALANLTSEAENAQNTWSTSGTAYASGNEPNITRWRTRYRIEIINPVVPEIQVKANYEWNTHNRVLLSNSMGVIGQDHGVDASFQAFGRMDLDAATNNRWFTSCDYPYGGRPDTSVSTDSCGYVWQNLQPHIDPSVDPNTGKERDNRISYRFQTVNGYTNPQAAAGTYGADAITLSRTNPRGGEGAGYLYMNVVPQKHHAYEWADTQKTGTYYADTMVPLRINAVPHEFVVNYYDAEGTLLTPSDGFNSGQKVDVATNFSIAVTSAIPDMGNKPFNGWKVVGYKNDDGDQETVGVIRNSVQGGTNIDIRDLRFTDGSRALTSGTGEVLIDEIALVANSDETVTGAQPAFYTARQDVDKTGQGNPTSSTLLTYRAVPGLKAVISQETRNHNKTWSDGSLTLPLAEDRSTMEIASLGTPSDSALVLYYGNLQATIAFAQVLKNDTGYDVDQPQPSDFSLQLTPVSSGTALTTASGAAPVTIEAGTYTLSVTTPSDPALAATWLPLSNSWSCQNGAGTSILAGDTLTVARDSGAITCQVTSTAAVVTLIGWDSTQNRTVDAAATVSVSASAPAHTVGDVALSGGTQGVNHYLTPQAVYSLAGKKAPAGMFLIGFERYRPTPPNPPALPASDVSGEGADSPAGALAARTNEPDWASDTPQEGTWEPVSMADGVASLTLEGNTRTIIRAVYARPNATQLPYTGGRAATSFLIFGSAALIIGVLSAAARMYRR